MGSHRTRFAGRLSRTRQRSTILVSLLVLGAACTVTSQATGRLVEVAADLESVRSFTLALENGEQLTFHVDTETDLGHFTPGHFSQHLLSAESITVTYTEEDKVLTAVALVEP